MKQKEILTLLENTPMDKMSEILFYLNCDIDILEDDIIQAILEYNSTHDPHIYNNMKEEYKRTFERIKKSTADKFSNSSFFRKYIKEISKNLTFKYISKSKFQHMVSLMAIDVISTCCIFSRTNKYDENYLDLFIESISNENYLKNEFLEVIEKDLYPLLINERTFYSDDYFDKYCDIHAKYLLEFEKNPSSHLLDQYKQEIQSLFSYSLDEIKKINNDQLENQFQQKVDMLKELESDRLEDIIEEHILSEFDEKFGKDIVDFLVEKEYDLIECYNDVENIITKFKHVYKKYFMNNEEKFLDYMKDSFEMLFSIYAINKENRSLNLMNLLYFSCEDILLSIFDYVGDPEDEEDEEAKHSLTVKLTNDAYELLAYGILYSPDYNQTEFDEIFNEFKEIVETNKKVKDLYHSLLTDYFSKHMDTLFSPITSYKLSTIKSILMCIDDKSVCKKVKKILFNQTRNPFLFNNGKKVKIEELTKKHAYLYDNTSNIKLLSYFHEFAVVFLLTYMNEHPFVAPNTAFMFFIKDCLNEFNYLSFHNIVNSFKKIIETNEKSDERKELIDTYREIENLICEIIEKCKNEDFLHHYLHSFYSALEAKKIAPMFYLKFDNVEHLLNRYQYEILYSIFMYNPKDRNEFLQLSFEEKANYVLQICLYMLFTEELQEATSLFPNASDINRDKQINTLNDTIQELKSEIELKNSECISLQNELAKCKSTQADIINKEVKQISLIYKNEITNLNKQIIEKDKKIDSLKENESELFKLRALMFSLQNDDETLNICQNIDLSSFTDKYAITLVGGHIRLIDRLKKKYPKLRFVSKETTVNESILETSDFIFILYNFLDHNTYYRVMNVVNRNPHIQWDYIAYTNLEKVENDIYNKLENSK